MVVISLKRCCSDLWSDRMVNHTTYRLVKLCDTKDNSHLLSLIENISFPPLPKNLDADIIDFLNIRVTMRENSSHTILRNVAGQYQIS